MQLVSGAYTVVAADITADAVAGPHTGAIGHATLAPISAIANPSKTATFADVTLSGFTGSTPVAIAAWSDPYMGLDGAWRVSAPGVAFIASDAATPETVIGVVLLTGTGPAWVLKAFELFESPVSMELAGDGFEYVPVVELPLAPWGTGVVVS